MPLALGIETSCDDTSVSLVKSTGEVLFNETQGQNEIHSPYGGIVPELASRNHSGRLLPLIEKALLKVPLAEIDIIAYTNRPGLLGALLIGSMTGRTLGWIWDKTVVGVNHIEGHIFSPFLSQANSPPIQEPTFPFLALIVSGSHTHLYWVEDFGKSRLLGATRDDAAGEALDKFGKMLGFSWPGGPHIDLWAAKATGGPTPDFPKIQTPGLSFSFSGIKSAGRRLLQERSTEWIKEHLPMLCAGYQEAVVNHLMEKLELAFQQFPCRQLVVGGGVSANSLFRNRLDKWSKKNKVQILLPEKTYCTDNAAMIAYTGLHYFLRKKSGSLPFVCSPRHFEQDFFNAAEGRVLRVCPRDSILES